MTSAEPCSWAEYIRDETERLLAEAGPDLVLAMIHARAIEDPVYYARSERRQKDMASAHFGITKAGYWERIALRAIVLLKVPIEQREALIEEAFKRNAEAKRKLAKQLKKATGSRFKEKTGEIDLSQISI